MPESEKRVFRRLTPVCDFCMEPNPAWDYPTEDFCQEKIPIPDHKQNALLTTTSRGHWAACDRCAEFIEANNRDSLLRRSLAHGTFADMDIATRSKYKPIVARLHDEFFYSRTGNRIPISEHEPDAKDGMITVWRGDSCEDDSFGTGRRRPGKGDAAKG